MPLGIDIGEIVITATPEGTTQYRNAIRRVDDDGGADEPFTIQTDSGTYVIGDAATDSGGNGSEPVGRLVGESSEQTYQVTSAAIEALLADTIESDSEDGLVPDSDGAVGYVDRGFEGDSVPAILSELGFDVERLDPGMAICYDVFEATPSGIGVAIGDGRAFATLAVAGVPVATAQVDYRDTWYDIGTAADAVEATQNGEGSPDGSDEGHSDSSEGRQADSEGPRADWREIQYESLLSDLFIDLAGRAPALGQPVAIALGGERAPSGMDEQIASVATAELGVEVESVTVAESPAGSLARGALYAVDGTGEGSTTIPAFAADAGYTPTLADVDAATAAFDEGRDRPTAKANRTADGTDPDELASAGVVSVDQDERHRARLATAHERLVGHLEAESEQLETVRGEVESATADIKRELDQLDEETAAADVVADMESSVGSLERTIDEMETDIAEIRGVLSGLDDDASFDAPEMSTDALGSMAVDTLQNDIDDVESNLSSRVDQLWSVFDDLNDELVDVRADLADLADVESGLESTRDAVEDLDRETDDLRRSIQGLDESLDDLEAETATTSDVESVSRDLNSVAGELESLRRDFTTAEWADPETVDSIGRDLDALRDTVLNQGKRLEGIERSTSDLDDRIERAFQDTAKAEALASVQTEVSRIRQSASSAHEMAETAESTSQAVDNTVAEIENDIEQFRSMIDSIAGSSATRSEMEEAIQDLEVRIEGFEATVNDDLADFEERMMERGVATKVMVQAMAGGLIFAGALSAFLVYSHQAIDEPGLAAAFFVLVAGPALFVLYQLESEP